jgi:DNA-binding NarL/FixJ family response regulator
MPITVFIIDDHGIVRDGLRLIVEAQGSDMRVIGEAADAREGLRKIKETCPDIVLMDIVMPGLDGIEATQNITELCPNTHVIILSMYGSKEHIFRGLQAGARGYILKESAGKEVNKAIRAVSAGHRYLSYQVTETMIDDYLCSRQNAPNKSPLETLSSRERQILKLVVEGKSSSEIGDLMFLSPKTVETYRSRMMEKLHIKHITDLVKFAVQHGLTSVD